jgi:phosphoribosylglycinamide formyltransferase 2
MQVADGFEVFSMLDGEKLREIIAKHRPDHVVPEVEAIRTEVLAELEAEGVHIVPSARATVMTMNRDRIRDVAAEELGLVTSRYRYAETLDEVRAAAAFTGYPCVIKPVMSSSGKGQSTVRSADELETAWAYAVANMRGDRARVIVEAFIDFDYEITLLTVAHAGPRPEFAAGGTVVSFCPPIGHRQERGDYQESWQPAAMSAQALADAQAMAAKVVANLGGHGLFGVEFFVKGDQVIFSELSPRPHDTGMVTLISQDLSEFDLHARAVLGLPVPSVALRGPAASAVLLADRDSTSFAYEGLADALATPGGPVDVRLFGKPSTRPWRRMGVALALGTDTDQARRRAAEAAGKLRIRYD